MEAKPFDLFGLGNLSSIFTIIGGIAAVLTLFVRNISLKGVAKNLYKFNPSLDVMENYDDMWKKLKQILQDEFNKGYPIQIKNVGLDLEKILPDLANLADDMYNKSNKLSFSYRGLIINSDSNHIAPLINGDSNIQSEFIKSSHKRLDLLLLKNKTRQNIKFAARKYDFPLVFHGLMINNKYLFLGFTEITNDKMYGSNKPYIYIEHKIKNKITNHYFSFYNHWFDYYWNYEDQK
ncbi:hypothetical protein [Tellurirhabdus bombi]|uniref:hypothetical protein n=1 Tax=Tellurirhabdus bombi TaxID=2907205 RepID=UPI001F1DA356|nr:hypothetical protein [Tellurirhabdus bombi]